MLPEIVYVSLYQEEKAPHRKRLYLPAQVTLSSGISLTIPSGFVSDLASVPRLFWGIISPSGRHDLAVLVHDYLLENNVPRNIADREMLLLLKKSKVSWIKRNLMYLAVRFYSFSVFF